MSREIDIPKESNHEKLVNLFVEGTIHCKFNFYLYPLTLMILQTQRLLLLKYNDI